MLNTNTVFSKVFLWLCIGLMITFGTGYAIQYNEPLLNTIFSGSYYFIIWIAEIVIAIVLSVRIHKMSSTTATIMYIIYTALTGLTFATIFIAYNLDSIIIIFGITALLMLIFGLIGYKTKLDLTKISTFLIIGLVAIILASVLSIFIESVALNLGLIIVSLLLFLVYIAYDIQMIKKRVYGIQDEDTLAIYGAFQLYLDFINVFLDLLRLFGREK